MLLKLFAVLVLGPVLCAQTGNPLKNFADKLAVSLADFAVADPAIEEEMSRLEDWIPTAPAACRSGGSLPDRLRRG
jgi:hypothetical protein